MAPHFLMLAIFSNRLRTDSGPASRNESHYEYLDRSARPSFAAIRDKLEAWLTLLPAVHRGELAIRLQSKDDHHFDAVFFELYLHVLAVCLGFSVIIHPRAGSRGKRPDFLLSMGGKRILLEAATVGELSEQGRAVRKRVAPIYDALNEIDCPDYFFHVEHTGEPATPIPTGALKRCVRQFLTTVHYDDVLALAASQKLDALPRTAFLHDGCRIEVSLLPVSREGRGRAGHIPVGMIGPSEAHTSIRNKIRDKARRYGPIRRPLIIAVNAAGRMLDHTDILEALFGKETYVIPTRGGRSVGQPVIQRNPDGAWFGPKGPQNRRVSAVLLVSSLLPWTVTVHPPIIYHNPWARYPLGSELDRIQSYRRSGDVMISSPGAPIHDILSLPAQWPLNIADTV
jgi:hypothetical protein